GTVQRAGSMSVNIDANSLLIVPFGFNLNTGFGTLNSSGIVHSAGTPLVVPVGKGFGGQGTINDPVTCSGTIQAQVNGGINLANGLLVSGSGAVNLGSGTLGVNDMTSGISSGSFASASLVIGAQSRGMFSQSAGTSMPKTLYIDNGTYSLSG